MDTNAKSIKISKRNTFVTLALILMTNLLLGTALSVMSKRAIREQMNERMLDKDAPKDEEEENMTEEAPVEKKTRPRRPRNEAPKAEKAENAE